MKCKKVWIEIIVAGTTVSLALALVMVILGAAAGAASQQETLQPPKPSANAQMFDGLVTCSKCGAKHSERMGQSASTCARVCVRGGAKFALVNADSLYLLDGNLSLLKRLAGERAQIVGTLHGSTIHVVSAKVEI
ncbi:MAG: hypothetical protein WAM79_16870 [Candidatus Sulfotelmatobacter sp.]